MRGEPGMVMRGGVPVDRAESSFATTTIGCEDERTRRRLGEAGDAVDPTRLCASSHTGDLCAQPACAGRSTLCTTLPLRVCSCGDAPPDRVGDGVSAVVGRIVLCGMCARRSGVGEGDFVIECVRVRSCMVANDCAGDRCDFGFGCATVKTGPEWACVAV